LIKALTIAGSDSSGGAGIQADLKTMSAFNVYGASVITAVTAQNTLGVQGIEILNTDIIEKQIDSVFEDLNIKYVKTGMLGTSAVINLVYKKLNEYNIRNIVVDPVSVAAGGDILLEKKAIKVLKNKLIRIAKIITPNIYEAKLLTGQSFEKSINYKLTAKKLFALGPEYVLIKGVYKKENEIGDLLYNGKKFKYIYSENIDTENKHGTGCTLSSAIISNIALGYSVEKAVEKSKNFISRGLKSGCKVGKGINPVNHLVKGIIGNGIK